MTVLVALPFRDKGSFGFLRHIAARNKVDVLPNTGTRLVPEYFCLIPEQIASKRNKSCIALSCLIPDYLPHSRTDLLKIRPIAR